MTIFLILIVLCLLFLAVDIIIVDSREPAGYVVSAFLIIMSFGFFDLVCWSIETKTVYSDQIPIERKIQVNNKTIIVIDNRYQTLDGFEILDKLDRNELVVYKQKFCPKWSLFNSSMTYYKIFDNRGKLLYQFRIN